MMPIMMYDDDQTRYWSGNLYKTIILGCCRDDVDNIEFGHHCLSGSASFHVPLSFYETIDGMMPIEM